MASVLYANMKHPELKIQYPNWNDRCKQIFKKWRALSTEDKAPFLSKARDNRSALRMKKAQQVSPSQACFYPHIFCPYINLYYLKILWKQKKNPP